MAVVTLDKVTKVFDGGVKAVDSLDLDVRDKEFVVLVGPSGCGKSTTLRMIAGLEDVTDGTISIDGRIVNDVAPKDRDIAMVFQNYALYPHMTVYENMAFSLKMRKFSKRETDERVREAAAILDLDDLLERKPKALSGGQRQRVAVGRAIVRKPKVFLFDEPLSNLDAKLRVQMRTEISKLHNRLEATILYVTHDQTEALTMGDRIVLMKDGLVQQIDDPMTMYSRPSNSFVAGFIGSPAMNFFEGEVRSEGTFAGPGGMAVSLSDAMQKVAGIQAPRKVMLGVRPEHISLGGGGGATIKAKVRIVEPMGSELYVYFGVGEGGREYIARIQPDAHIVVGSSIELAINIDKAHLFDGTTGDILV